MVVLGEKVFIKEGRKGDELGYSEFGNEEVVGGWSVGCKGSSSWVGCRCW